MIRKVILFSVVMVAVGAAAAFAFPPIDLTTAGSTYTGADNVIWNQITNQPTGTGVYDPFLRVQAVGVEEGYNTDATPNPPLDDKAGIWTHSLTLGSIHTVKFNGVDYYDFRCDINEPVGHGAELLSLDSFQLYTSSDAGAPSVTNLATLPKTLRYDMDGTVDQTVYMNYALNNGSGQDDLEVLVPASYFAGAASTDNLILYTKFGATGAAYQADFSSADGFEEWSAFNGPAGGPPPNVPEPTTLLLLGGGALGLVGAVRRKK